MATPIKLAHFMARAGVASRRASEELIRERRVKVNGQVVDRPAERVDPDTDRVTMGRKWIRVQRSRTVLLHKPTGFVCSAADPYAERLAIDLLNIPKGERLFSIGRLDKDSEGLLLFTSDGDLAQRLTHPKYGIERCYEVDVRGTVDPSTLKKLEKGITDDGERLRAESVTISSTWRAGARLRFVVKEGKKREIRRMCRRLRLKVSRLRRTAFGPLRLGKFNPGSNRELTAAELKKLRAAAGL